jgi:ribose transport system ATP-binding protein
MTERGAAAKRGVSSPHAINLVEVRGVNKSFGETHALRGCSFSARAGEVHAIVGENGSGKSTLAKLLAGVEHPDSGSVRINGKAPDNPHTARAMGIEVVFQEVLVAEGGTVLDNLFIGYDGMFRARSSQRQKRAQARALLDRLVGVRVDLDALIDELPLNTRQWIVIARTLINQPRLAVFDESTAALDHSGVERFFEVVRGLKAAGTCVLIVTHRIHELTAICDRATVLSDGVAVGTLAGGEIAEARLLALMRGGAPSEALRPVEAERPARRTRIPADAVLVISKLRPTLRANPIDLVVRPGEIVGLAGLEGHGQVEFIQTICGIRRPVFGQVYVQRGGTRYVIDSVKSADRANLTYIPGDRKTEGVFANLSVFENFGIACYRRTSRAGFIDRRGVARMFYDRVKDLSIRIGRVTAPISSLSGGNQQKIVVGRALASAPLVLALNDPTRGVDISAKLDLYALLQRLAEEGKAILFLSNEIEEFVDLCDRVAVFRSQSLFGTLEGGEITAEAVLAAMFGYRDARDLDRAGP